MSNHHTLITDSRIVAPRMHTKRYIVETFFCNVDLEIYGRLSMNKEVDTFRVLYITIYHIASLQSKIMSKNVKVLGHDVVGISSASRCEGSA